MRALVCTLDKAGFLHPAIGLATALRARGHEVAFVADRTAVPALARAGFERLPRGPHDGRSFQTEEWLRPLAVQLQLQHVEHAMSCFAPDLVVGQPLALGPLLARERHGVPVAVLGHAVYGWPGGVPASPEVEWRRVRRLRTMLRLLEEARTLARLPPCPAGAAESRLHGDAFLLRSVPRLHGATRLPARAHFAGACLWEPAPPPDGDLAAWLAAARRAGEPIACAHHGRAFGGRAFWVSLLDAFAAGGLRVAASTSGVEPGLEQRAAGLAAFHLRPYLPASSVLPRAQVMVGAAASSAVLGALGHGVPCLLVPGGDEQHELAEQVERCGAGRILPQRDLSPTGLRRAVEAVLADGALRDNALMLARSLAAFRGFAAAVDVLEMIAHGSPRNAERVAV